MPINDDNEDFTEFETLPEDEIEQPDNAYENYAENSRKKRQAIFYAVLGVMVLLGASSAWFVFMGNGATETATPAVPLSSPATTAPNTTAPAVAEAPVAPSTGNALPPGVLSPQDMVNATATVDPQQQQQVASDTPSVPAADPALIPEDAAIPPPAVDAGSPTIPAPVNGTMAEALPPPVDNANTAQNLAPIMPSEPAVTAPAVLPPVTETGMAAMPAPVAETTPITPVTAPSATIDASASDQRLAQMEQQLQSLTSEVNAARAQAPSATDNQGNAQLAAQLQALSDKLDNLGKRVAELDQRTTDIQGTPAPASEQLAPVSVPEKAVVKKPASRKAKPAKSAASNAPKWELRSAQPGVAWLGKLGSDDMSRYAVGQDVPGLGVIQAVTQENNRWIVKASGGTLRQ